jgi:soluble P-type ATPase
MTISRQTDHRDKTAMLEIHIPSRGLLRLECLVLDVNGTIALDGQLLPGVGARLGQLH